ncbi:hypothetical protein L7F22_037979 [Adiantum nelumboides]|nr:hypothetical protein [Adiantum nelumboides]
MGFEKLRRAPLDESSCVVKDILNSISSVRVASYTEAGCRHVQSDQQTLVKLNKFLKGLHDHIPRAQSLVEELEKLVAKVIRLMDADLESLAARRLLNLHLKEDNEDVEQSAASQVYWLKKLVDSKMKEGTPMSNHLNEFNTIYSQLSTQGVKFDEPVRAMFLLITLPKSWDTFCTALSNSAPLDGLTIAGVEGSLLTEETNKVSKQVLRC